jgi:hypothetical protein
MIRKILVVAAAIAIPVTTITAIGAVVGTGVAGARAQPPTPITCVQTGTVTFAKPGLSYDASLSKKSTAETQSTTSGTGTGCSTKANKLKIISDTTPCSQMSPTPPTVCSTGDVAKDPNYYDAATQYASGSTLTDLENALANGIATEDNGTKVTLEYGSAAVSSTCTASLGFTLSGNVYEHGAPISPQPLQYTDNICLVGDGGANTTGSFETDLIADQSATGLAIIHTASIGGGANPDQSELVISDGTYTPPSD